MTLAKELTREKQAMRDIYCRTLMELAEDDRNIVALDADLMGAMGMRPFAAKFPKQAIDCGIQEANMIGVACGLSQVGKIPFAHTFGPFATRRVCDQVFVSGAYARSNVKIVGSDPGITAQINGATHMPFEDMSIMRCIPTMTILEPTDAVMLHWILRQIAHTYGMYYMRLVRKECIKIYEDDSAFEMGKAVQIMEGKDLTIISSGFCVSESIQAARTLAAQGIHARVLNIFCWKPIDVEAVVEASRETGAIVTAENHNVINGLGSAVAEVLAKNAPAPVEMIGVQDTFGEVGNLAYLADRFHLTEKYIVEAAQRVMGRKERR